jgi:hypothetical protein
MRTLIQQLVFGAIVTLSVAQIPVQAAAKPQTRGDITYITGGVGADEREKLKQMEKDFNLKLVFAEPGGRLTSDVAVVVKDTSGKPVLTEPAAGPVFLAKLPPGTYVVETMYEGKKQTRKVTVGQKLRTAQFVFPPSRATDVAMPEGAGAPVGATR